MGADTKSLRTRIRSVDSTLHLTKAMGLVASSKIRKANDRMLRGREYAAAVSGVVEDLSASPECQRSPYMRQTTGERVRLIVIAGDRGLCGGYNANIFRLMREYPDAEVIPIGKRAWERYGGDFYPSETYSSAEGSVLAERLCREFTAGEFDRLGIVSSRYLSVLSQQATVTWVLPLEKKSEGTRQGTLFEPDEAEILNAAVPEYVSGVLMACVRESFACEVAARRTAMDSAGKNAEEMIGQLQLEYNRARQSAITQEITEIVAGAGE